MPHKSEVSRENIFIMNSRLIEIYNRFTELQAKLVKTDSEICGKGFKLLGICIFEKLLYFACENIQLTNDFKFLKVKYSLSFHK